MEYNNVLFSLNPQTYKGGGCHLPVRFSVAVRLSVAHILRQVSCYGYETWRHK